MLPHGYDDLEHGVRALCEAIGEAERDHLAAKLTGDFAGLPADVAGMFFLEVQRFAAWGGDTGSLWRAFHDMTPHLGERVGVHNLNEVIQAKKRVATTKRVEAAAATNAEEANKRAIPTDVWFKKAYRALELEGKKVIGRRALVKRALQILNIAINEAKREREKFIEEGIVPKAEELRDKLNKLEPVKELLTEARAKTYLG